MINVKIKTNGVQRYMALLNEKKPKYDVLKREAITWVNAHTVKMIIRYARIDSVRCLNGQ